MKTAIRSPHNCNNSIYFTDMFICKLSTLPCALHFNKECELDKLDKLDRAHWTIQQEFYPGGSEHER